jgi:hypothetical protein
MIALAALTASTTASAQVYVHGYTTKNGTYVAPHYRSAPDGNPYNNYSTRGNVNPYTGQVGTKGPYSSYGNSSYGSYGNYSNPYSSSGQSNSSNTQGCIYYTPC